MSSDALKWAKRQAAGGTGPKGLLLLLADYADSEHSCYPGQSRLAAELECSERSVRDWLVTLEERQLVRRRARMRKLGRGRTSDRYILAVDSPAGEGADSGRDTGKERRSNRDDPFDQPADGSMTNRRDLPVTPGDQPAAGSGPTGSTCRGVLREPPDLVQPAASASVARAAGEAEAEGVDVGQRAAQLLAELVAVIGDHDIAQRLYEPGDAGGRIALGRELAMLEASGWPTRDLVVEVAGGVHAASAGSLVAVLLTRARRLEGAPFVVGDSTGITTEPAARWPAHVRTGAARRHGQNLAESGLPADVVVAELDHAYPSTPDAEWSAEMLAALAGAGLVDDNDQPTAELLKALGAA